MATRTTSSSVVFSHPFTLKGVEGCQPAGTYDVDTEEEVIETLNRTVYRRVATLLIIRGIGITRTVTIDPADLLAALERDRCPTG